MAGRPYIFQVPVAVSLIRPRDLLRFPPAVETNILVPTELKMTEWKTTEHISASSQSSIAAQQKTVLADGSLCSRQQTVYVGEGVAAKIIVFVILQNFRKIFNFMFRVPPCAASAPMQIVPISASIYTVFNSVLFNSVLVQYLYPPFGKQEWKGKIKEKYTGMNL